MTARFRRPASALLAVLLLAVCPLAGCTSEDPPAPLPDRAAPSPTTPPVTRATVTEAPYGQESDAAPAVRLLGAVDLSPAAEGPSAFASAVASGPDGSAYVLVTSPDSPGPHRLATVDAADGAGGLAVAGSVPVPGMRLIWGLHPLPDGTVAVAGWFQPAERGFGFTVVDPAAGRNAPPVRTIQAIPHEEGTAAAYGNSALSADGSTLLLFVGTTVGYRSTDLLVAVDAATGEFRAGRDLFDDTRRRSMRSIGRNAAGLVPRPDGGVVLAFAGTPPGGRHVPVPMLLTYDADLAPVDVQEPGGVGATGETVAVAAGDRGTVFVAVSAQGDEWLLAGGTAGTGAATRVLELVPRGFDYSFVVDPSESWLLLPAVDGVRTVDLAGGQAATIGLDCGMSSPARLLAAGSGAVTALAVGECARGDDRVPTLWAFGS